MHFILHLYLICIYIYNLCLISHLWFIHISFLINDNMKWNTLWKFEKVFWSDNIWVKTLLLIYPQMLFNQNRKAYFCQLYILPSSTQNFVMEDCSVGIVLATWEINERFLWKVGPGTMCTWRSSRVITTVFAPTAQIFE